jgi:hypothetical protein
MSGITRRAVLRDGTALAVAVMSAGAAGPFGGIAVGVTPGRAAYLTEEELQTLRGLTDIFIPGKPFDADHGAIAAGCAEAIDALLGAFKVKPPRIYAGGPFSDRAGSPVNHFEDFLRLDAYERKAWRLRIEGSRGRPELEWGGAVKGWQAVYREGIASLEEAAGERRFADLSPLERERIVRTGNEAVADLVDIAWPHTYQFMYGAPEYGGNRDLIAWKYANWDGDVHPRGYTREDVEEPHPEQQPLSAADLALLRRALPLAALGGSSEVAHNLVASSGSSARELRAQIAPLIRDEVDLDGA